jgi:hypothetical protein
VENLPGRAIWKKCGLIVDFVDSSVWVDYFRGIATPQTDILDLLLGHEALAIGDLNLCGDASGL